MLAFNAIDDNGDLTTKMPDSMELENNSERIGLVIHFKQEQRFTRSPTKMIFYETLTVIFARSVNDAVVSQLSSLLCCDVKK